MKVYIIYDDEDLPKRCAIGLKEVAEFLDLSLGSLRTYISKGLELKDGFKIYEYDEEKEYEENEELGRIL